MAPIPVYSHPDVAALITLSLAEDLRATGDLTCQALVQPGRRLAVTVTAKGSGIVCGLPIFAQVFAALTPPNSPAVTITELTADGTSVAAGDVVLRGHGDAAVLLQGERTALNIAQRLSGTATITHTYVQAVAGTKAGIFDTRKTTPGLRLLQKHAVLAGGGRNHRIGLYDQVLIKENHIALMAPGHDGSPAAAVAHTRATLGNGIIIECEIEHLADLAPVIRAGADIILCDNMGPVTLREAIAIRGATPSPRPRVDLEASGGITLTTIRAVAETGVDRISVGALTHSAPCFDLSMRCTPV